MLGNENKEVNTAKRYSFLFCVLLFFRKELLGMRAGSVCDNFTDCKMRKQKPEVAAAVSCPKEKDRVSDNNKKSFKDDKIDKFVLIPTKLFLYKFKYGIL